MSAPFTLDLAFPAAVAQLVVLLKMKNLIPAFILFALTTSGCDNGRQEVISEQRDRVADKIRIGDDIHKAKSQLVELGFRIDYGPDFPTKSQKYLMMIVDYGVSPTGMETFKYTVGMSGGSDKPIDGIIKATPDGVITSIE